MTLQRVTGSEWRVDGDNEMLAEFLKEVAKYGPQRVHVAGATYEVRVVPAIALRSTKDVLSEGGPLDDDEWEADPAD